jgi:hypothetical protein
MKNLSFFILTYCLLTVQLSLAQGSDESIIRMLENSEREAILKGDTATLLKLLSPQIAVYNPENNIVTFKAITERIKSGKINYSSFQRKIKHVSIVENIAIVMGTEIVTPQGTTTHAGKTVTRSFTNVWMKSAGSWKLTARQATITLVD